MIIMDESADLGLQHTLNTPNQKGTVRLVVTVSDALLQVINVVRVGLLIIIGLILLNNIVGWFKPQQ